MFYIGAMQTSFAFARFDLARWRDQLGPVVLPDVRLTPANQLVKSIISAQTYDAKSLRAYDRLAERYDSLAALAEAAPCEIAEVIEDVTHAATKAEYLAASLRMIAEADPDFRLTHLAAEPLGAALAWLERLPGVGRKVSASALNASTLARPVMIVDTHVLRALQRQGLVSERADYRSASEAVTAAMSHWSGDDFLGLHIALKRLGQEVCRRDGPACERCPLAGGCARAIGN